MKNVFDTRISLLLPICLFIFWITCICFGMNHYKNIKKHSNEILEIQNNIVSIRNDIEKMQNDIVSIKNDNLNEETVSGEAKQEILQTDTNIAFLEGQIKSHQEFIEREREFLVWMLGVIFAVGGACIGFVGFKSSKEIKEIIEQKYKDDIGTKFEKISNDLDDRVEERLARAVGGNENLQYLKTAVKKEKDARSKNIYFIKQKDSEKLDEVISWIEKFYGENTNGKITSAHASPNLFNSLKEDKKYLEYDIFIYEVSFDEFISEDGNTSKRDENLNYKVLSDFCKDENKQCVLACFPVKGRSNINQENIKGASTTTVKFSTKLRETLQSLLYR